MTGVDEEQQLKKGGAALPCRRCDDFNQRSPRFMTFTDSQISAGRVTVERLEALLTDADTPLRLTAAMRHAVLGGGKRFRPFLVIESARLFGASKAAAVDVAAALECVHCYSLVHDDLPAMDNDEQRRGLPTVWTAYDEWTAILAGDALLTLAFEVIAASPVIDVACKVALVRELARAAGRAGMVGGQQFDLEADKLGHPAVATLDHVRRLQAMKTGALIRFACTAGVYLGGGTDGDHAALAMFGDNLGFAFQISDDLLDATGDAATVGKAVAKDAAAGKATLVSLMGQVAARAKLAEVEAAAIATLDVYGARAETLRAAARFVSRRTS
jgi:farnesyl diphosphate synthase